MPRGYGNKSGKGGKYSSNANQGWSPKKPQSQGKGSDEKVIPSVPMDGVYSLWIQRGYPSEQGNSFMMRGGATRDGDLVDYRTMGARMSHMNSEAYNRVGKFLSMSSAAITEGAEWIEKYGTPEKLQKTGLPTILEFLSSDSGAAFIEAAKHLNDGRKEHRTTDSVEKAVISLFSIWGQPDVAELGNSCKRLQLFAKKVYDLAANMNEGFAAMHNRDRWAEELGIQASKMPRDVKGFLQDPEDDKALLQAVVACYTDQVLAKKVEGQRRQTLDEEDDEEEPLRKDRRRDSDSEMEPKSVKRKASEVSTSMFGKAAKRSSPAAKVDTTKASLFGSSLGNDKNTEKKESKSKAKDKEAVAQDEDGGVLPDVSDFHDETLMDCNFMILLAQHPRILGAEADEIVSLVEAFNENPDIAKEQLVAYQRDFLTNHIMELDVAEKFLLEVTPKFARWAKNGPSVDEYRKVLGYLEDDLRSALDLPLMAQLQNMKIKPRVWKKHMARVLTVLHMVHDAFFVQSSM
jgi:hypothetical protein